MRGAWLHHYWAGSPACCAVYSGGMWQVETRRGERQARKHMGGCRGGKRVHWGQRALSGLTRRHRRSQATAHETHAAA